MNRIKKLLVILLNRKYLSALLRTGTAAGVEHEPVLGYLASLNVQTVIDVGANRGQFALCARSVMPATRIISFEPLSEPAEVFRKVFQGDESTQLMQMAVGSTDEKRTIHVSKADDSSSLLPITDRQELLFPGTAEKETREVSVKKLNDVIERPQIDTPALLKIDVQGFEKEVLIGSEEVLPVFSYVYAECSFMELYADQSPAHEVIAFLSDHGFDLAGVYNLSYDRNGIAIQGDFLFVRHKSIEE
jgi:FkbM family methyltransferase